MYDFLTKLINISLPKIRDFRGIPSKSFDGRGNYMMGIKDNTIFSEVNIDNIDRKIDSRNDKLHDHIGKEVENLYHEINKQKKVLLKD